jgi:DNA-binding transcriptional MerR regulator
VKNPLGTKLYYSIGEVAQITQLQPYTLRAWEKEFACLRPRRSRGKNRAYRERDIGVILLIKSLLYDERYTTQGVKQKLKNEPELVRRASCELPGPRQSTGDQVMPEEVMPAETLGQPAETIVPSLFDALSPALAPFPVRTGRVDQWDNLGKAQLEAIKKELNEILRLL